MIEILGKPYSKPEAHNVFKEFKKIIRFCYLDDQPVQEDLLDKYGPKKEERPRPPIIDRTSNRGFLVKVKKRWVHI